MRNKSHVALFRHQRVWPIVHEYRYSLVPKESNVTLVPHITFIRPNTLLVKAVMTLFWVNTKRKTVMTLIRIVLLSNGFAVITLFKIYLKRVMTDPFTFECHYSFLDHVKLKLQSWLSFGVTSFISALSWLSLGTTHNPSVLTSCYEDWEAVHQTPLGPLCWCSS